MAFLVPAVLAGAAAIAAPIAIHLLNKTQVKVVRWAAIRFLQESLQKNQRRLQIEDLILLLLRCAFIILLALAFARLVLNPGGAQEAVGSGPVVAVVLVDQSASMGQSNGFQTLFDEAKTAAGKLISGMPGGSQVALFLVGEHVNQAVPRPTANLPLVRRTLDVAETTDGTSDMGAAVRLAIETLKPFSGAKKEIYAFSDNQASAWAQPEQIKALLAETPDVKFTVVSPSATTGADNLAITSLKPESNVQAAGRLAGFLVEVSNFGTTPANGVRVTLAIDDAAPVDETLLDDIEPGKSKIVRLNAKFAEPGYYTLRAAIPADRMPVDNERAVAVHVIEHMNVAVVEGSASKGRDNRDAFFLVNGLAPVPPSRRADYYLKIEAVPQPWLQSSDLSRQDAIFLANPGKLDAAAAKNLEKYVREGGSLVIFPGAQTTPAALNDDPVLAPMMPAKLAARKTSEDKALTWQAGKYTHPVASLWNDANNGNLGTVRTTAWFPLTPVAAKDGAAAPQTLVAFSDGTPAALETPYGKGRVVLFSTAATTDGNNFPIHPNFVPFLQRLLGYLSPKASSSSLVLAPGAVFQGAVSNDLVKREVSVITPGSKGRARPAGKVEAANQSAVVRYHDTAKTGAYRFVVDESGRSVTAFAVQMDAKESDLRMLSADELAQLKGGEAAASVEQGAAPVVKVRKEFWVYFVVLAFLVFLIEMVLAHRFSFSR